MYLFVFLQWADMAFWGELAIFLEYFILLGLSVGFYHSLQIIDGSLAQQSLRKIPFSTHLEIPSHKQL